MKTKFFLLTIFLIGLISLASAFESDIYSINTEVGTNGIDVSVGDNSINVDVTSECSLGETTCSGTNYLTCVDESWSNNGNVEGLCGYTTIVASSGGGGGGGSSGGSSTSLLSSAIDYLSNTLTGNSEENSDSGSSLEESIETIPQETSSTSFITGAVTSATDFVKSPEGKVSLGAMALIVLAAVFILLKKDAPINNKFYKKDESLKEEFSKETGSVKEEKHKTDNNLNE